MKHQENLNRLAAPRASQEKLPTREKKPPQPQKLRSQERIPNKTRAVNSQRTEGLKPKTMPSKVYSSQPSKPVSKSMVNSKPISRDMPRRESPIKHLLASKEPDSIPDEVEYETKEGQQRQSAERIVTPPIDDVDRPVSKDSLSYFKRKSPSSAKKNSITELSEEVSHTQDAG